MGCPYRDILNLETSTNIVLADAGTHRTDE